MRAKIYPITQLGRPVLRRRSKNVAAVTSAKMQAFVADMIATMKKAQGVGIAAPQVGVGLRAFIVAPEPSVRYPKAPSFPPVAMFNPKLLRHSARMITDWEGCLSIPGIRGRVPRYQWVEIEFISIDGKKRRARLTDFIARIFQHEFDHINGHVYLDRVRDTRTLMTEEEFRSPYTRRVAGRRR
jgi:peptide deformylase